MTSAYLKRYTDITALVSLLTEHKITLLDPALWDDKNDSRFLSLYQDRINARTVLALCFVQAEERYHHWRVFAYGAAGVCIRFDRSRLVRSVSRFADVRVEQVRYLTLKQLQSKRLKISELPFVKRSAFQDEKELRMIYESDSEVLEYLDIPIPLACVSQIILSPWLPKSLSANVKALLQSIKGCGALEVVRSTLIRSEAWYRHGKAAR